MASFPRILRYRETITHTGPVNRTVSDEFTLLNEGNGSIEYIVLQAYKYRPGMTIRDEDGSVLGVFTNEVVRTLLRQSTDPGDRKLLDDINSRRIYVQWIPLPKHRPLEPNKTRVITFTYTDQKRPGRTINSVSKLLFNIPEFDIEKITPPSETFSTTITVLPPSGFRLQVENSKAELAEPPKSRSLTKNDHYHLTHPDNIIDTNIPHLDQGSVTFSLRYGVYPDRSEQRALESFIAILLSLSLLVFLLALLTVYPSTPIPLIWQISNSTTSDVIKARVNQVASGVILISLAFIGLTTNPLTQRIKYWAALALVMSSLALLPP